MKTRRIQPATLLSVAVPALLGAGLVAVGSHPGRVATSGTGTRTASPPTSSQSTATAQGTFDVEALPVDEQAFPDGTTLGRYSLAKQYHGDLEATGDGEMLTGATPIETSGAYVAIERVDGTLAGRRGSFLLQHIGTMTEAGQSLSITVVPDSGTGELAGIEGTLEVEITGDEHHYELEYTLPAGR